MADLRISDLPELLSGQLQADDPLAITDVSASTTKKVKASVLVLDGIKVLPDGSIPGSKVDSGSLPAGSVGTAELEDKSVTAAKLADRSSADIGTALPAAGAFIGQLFVTTSPEKKIYAWNGSSWVEASGLASADGSTAGLVNTYVTTVDDKATITADIDNTTGGGQFLAGPAGSSGAVTQRVIVSTDLPTAGAQKGAVAVNGNGLAMSGDTISLSKGAASQANNQLVQYDDQGLVVSGSPIQPIDLPVAIDGQVGAVQPGPGLSVDGTGSIGIDNTVVGGTFPKITFNEQGLCTAGQSLIPNDIPPLDASKIETGVFGSNFLDEDSVTKSKLADYSITYIQEAQPGITSADHIGILWYQESTAQLRMWNGNSFRPVGFGRLSAENLRWGGVIDASTGLMKGVTEAGTTAGLTIGQPLPTATDQLGGLYVLVDVAGSAIGVTPGISYDPGDWCLCVSASEGWIRIDNVGGGGGGGGATNLGDLLDVTLSSEETGDLLQLQANGQWQNIKVLDCGTF